MVDDVTDDAGQDAEEEDRAEQKHGDEQGARSLALLDGRLACGVGGGRKGGGRGDVITEDGISGVDIARDHVHTTPAATTCKRCHR